MKRLLLIVFVVLFLTPDADAFIFRRLFRPRTRSYSSAPSRSFAGTPAEVAQQKANYQAARNRMGHPGGSFAGCRYEGVGSGSTPEQALSNCCYTGQKQVAGYGVAQGSNGRWYACKLYY